MDVFLRNILQSVHTFIMHRKCQNIKLCVASQALPNRLKTWCGSWPCSLEKRKKLDITQINHSSFRYNTRNFFLHKNLQFATDQDLIFLKALTTSISKNIKKLSEKIDPKFDTTDVILYSRSPLYHSCDSNCIWVGLSFFCRC